MHITEISSAESSHSLVTGIVLDSFPVEAELTQSACLRAFFLDTLTKFKTIQRRVEFLKISKFLRICKLRLLGSEEGISAVEEWLHEPPTFLDWRKSLL